MTFKKPIRRIKTHLTKNCVLNKNCAEDGSFSCMARNLVSGGVRFFAYLFLLLIFQYVYYAYLAVRVYPFNVFPFEIKNFISFCIFIFFFNKMVKD